MPAQTASYEPDDEIEFRWGFPPTLPADGWVSTSRPLGRRDRRRLKRALLWRMLKLLLGAAVAMLLALSALAVAEDRGLLSSIVICSVLAIAYMAFIASEALALRRFAPALRSRILVVRYRRPEGADWPEDLSPPAEYLESSRELWDDRPRG